MVSCCCQKELGLITVICLVYIQAVSSLGIDKSCNLTIPFQCGPNESCDQISSTNLSGLCKCESGFQRVPPDNACVVINPTTAPDVATTPVPAPSSLPEHHRAIVGVLLPLFLVLAALMGLGYAARRYKWIQKLRAMRQRRYDEVQFGQEEDDPPLA